MTPAPHCEYPQVVKIFTTSQEPDFGQPWRALAPARSTGSGVLIGPGRVLTGAHVVAHANFLQVQHVSAPDRYVAELEAICHDSDLALLRLREAPALDNVTPAVIGELPKLRDKVTVVGYPIGGEEISFTEGVVSRIEVQRYSHSQRHLLAVTVDAAINAGNSGGPVFKDDRVVGIAFQKLDRADNIGEMVPVPIIRQFLDSVEANRPSQVPGLGLWVQPMENPLLRRHKGMPDDVSGALILEVQYGSSAWGALKAGDVLLRLNEHDVANNLTAVYRGHRTTFEVSLGERFIGDTVEAEILRDGQRLKVSLVLAPVASLVPRCIHTSPRSWFVYGGLVFQPLSHGYLSTWSRWWENGPKSFIHAYYHGHRTEDRQQLIALTQVLSDPINVGYEEIYDELVGSVNGQAPRDLAHFVSLVDAAEGLVEIVTARGAVLVLDPEAVAAQGPAILARYQVPVDRSPDMPGVPVPAL